MAVTCTRWLRAHSGYVHMAAACTAAHLMGRHGVMPTAVASGVSDLPTPPRALLLYTRLALLVRSDLHDEIEREEVKLWLAHIKQSSQLRCSLRTKSNRPTPSDQSSLARARAMRQRARQHNRCRAAVSMRFAPSKRATVTRSPSITSN